MSRLEYPHEVAVAEELFNTNELETGDCAYLVVLVAECPSSMDYMDFAQTVKNYSIGKKHPKYKDGVG